MLFIFLRKRRLIQQLGEARWCVQGPCPWEAPERFLWLHSGLLFRSIICTWSRRVPRGWVPMSQTGMIILWFEAKQSCTREDLSILALISVSTRFSPTVFIHLFFTDTKRLLPSVCLTWVMFSALSRNRVASSPWTPSLQHQHHARAHKNTPLLVG